MNGSCIHGHAAGSPQTICLLPRSSSTDPRSRDGWSGGQEGRRPTTLVLQAPKTSLSPATCVVFARVLSAVARVSVTQHATSLFLVFASPSLTCLTSTLTKTRPYSSSVNRPAFCSTPLCAPLICMKDVQGAERRDMGGESVDGQPRWSDLVWVAAEFDLAERFCLIKEAAALCDEAWW
nr:hypothetical protein BKA70DRAFT_1302748 [Coprinopsis sp. MPI-PUGE-AT-0042]